MYICRPTVQTVSTRLAPAQARPIPSSRRTRATKQAPVSPSPSPSPPQLRQTRGSKAAAPKETRGTQGSQKRKVAEKRPGQVGFTPLMDQFADPPQIRGLNKKRSTGDEAAEQEQEQSHEEDIEPEAAPDNTEVWEAASKITNKRWVGSDAKVEYQVLFRDGTRGWRCEDAVSDDLKALYHRQYRTKKEMPTQVGAHGVQRWGPNKHVVKYTRMPKYTEAEDAILIKYVKHNVGKTVERRSGKHKALQKIELTVSGNLLWKQAAETDITGTGRSFDSLRDHYLKYLHK